MFLVAQPPPSYWRLARKFPLVTIHSDDHLAAASDFIRQLLKKGRLDAGEESYLAALSEMVIAYEKEYVHFPNVSDAAMLAHLMDARGVTQSAVAHATGLQKSMLSELLSGKRQLSRKSMQKFAKYFGVSAAVFLSTAEAASTAKPKRRSAGNPAGLPRRKNFAKQQPPKKLGRAV